MNSNRKEKSLPKKINFLIKIAVTCLSLLSFSSCTQQQLLDFLNALEGLEEIRLSTAKTYSGGLFLGKGIQDDTFLPRKEVITVEDLSNTEFNYKLFSEYSRETLDKGIKVVKDNKLTLAKQDLYIFLNKINNPYSYVDKVILEIESANAGKQKFTFKYRPHQIRHWTDLQAMRLDLSGNYTLGKDINFPKPGKNGFPQKGFYPIGSTFSPFTGSLKGNNHKISNFYIERNTIDYVGLFGKIKSDYKNKIAVESLTLKLRKVTTERKHSIEGRNYVGALVGQLINGKVSNVNIKGGIVKGTMMVGGLVGRNGDIAIVKRWPYIKIIKSPGYIQYGSFKGKVVGDFFLGDLVGRNDGLIIK